MTKAEFVEKRMQLESMLIETKAKMIGDLVVERIGEPVQVTHESGHGCRKWKVDVRLPKHTLFSTYSLMKLEKSIQELVDDKNLNVVVHIGLDGCIVFTMYFN